MGRRGRKRWGYSDQPRPKPEPLKGPVIGMIRLNASYREEGVIAQGYASERWQLTDNVNFLLAPDEEFVVGSSLQEVQETLEARHPSPVAGLSMIEVLNASELKLHTMPFGGSVLTRHEKNPNWNSKHRWGDEYITIWLPDKVKTLTKLCAGGNDVLVSVEAEEQIRSDDDFEWSDLVISKRDRWYSVVKYKPSKAAARRKGRTTISTKAQHAADLVSAGNQLRIAAAEAYTGLLEELTEFEVTTVLDQVTRPNSYGYRSDYDEPKTKRIIRQLKALIRIHAALRGRRVYRYNAAWQDLLKAVRERPKDLDNDTWGNYRDVKEWLEAECKIKRPKPTQKMLAAKASAEAAALRARTCATCGTVADQPRDLYHPHTDHKAKYAPGAKLCGDCWGAELVEPATAETT